MADTMHMENRTSSAKETEVRNPPRIEQAASDSGEAVSLSGVWATHTVAGIDAEMREREARVAGTALTIDMAGVTYLDTAGAWIIFRFAQAAKNSGTEALFVNVRGSHQVLLEAVDRAMETPEEAEVERKPNLFIRMLAAVGENVYHLGEDLKMGLHILGAAVRGSQMKLGHGNGLSVPSVINQIDRMGVRALPIIILMSTIIGAIIAQQGAFQLRYFGAEIFVVDLVGILVLRELGVLVTAIMIAGRSGSAITAEIGSMKMREEVDALTVIGLNPVGVLVFPRLVALVIAVPLLTFVADIAALLGAMFVASAYSGISPDAFITRVRDAVDLTTVYAGLIKAPFMAIIIGIIASVEGMKVGGSAESLGSRVTASVVKSIFIVIVVDGIFAIFFAAVDF